MRRSCIALALSAFAASRRQAQPAAASPLRVAASGFATVEVHLNSRGTTELSTGWRIMP